MATYTPVAQNVARRGFSVTGQANNASDAPTIVSATTGKSIYLQSILLNNSGAGAVSLGHTAAAGSLGTVILGPIYIAANSYVAYQFDNPIKLPVSKALEGDQVANHWGSWTVEGCIE